MPESWPIIEKAQATRAIQPDGAVPVGINRMRGEGGFWGKIVFQDAKYPSRYAFIEQTRTFDPDASGVAGDMIFADSIVGVSSNQTVFPNQWGERSLWNDPASPATSGYIALGRVLNWAQESNNRTYVPLGSLVWIRPGQTYSELEFQTPRDDYTFSFTDSAGGGLQGLSAAQTTAGAVTGYSNSPAAPTAGVTVSASPGTISIPAGNWKFDCTVTFQNTQNTSIDYGIDYYLKDLTNNVVRQYAYCPPLGNSGGCPAGKCTVALIFSLATTRTTVYQLGTNYTIMGITVIDAVFLVRSEP